MPRVRRRGHEKRDQYGHLTRAQLIRELLDCVAYPAVTSLMLVDVPEQERAGLVEEALEIFYAERHERRLPMLRERLETWPVETWGTIFCEAPELQDELTDGQRHLWEEWREEAERSRKRETGDNIIAMPAAKAIQ